MLRVLSTLIVNFEISLVCPLQLASFFHFPDCLPSLRHHFWQRAFVAGHHCVLSSRNVRRNHSRRRSSPILHHCADYKCVFAIVIAGVIRVDSVDVRSRLTRNCTEYSFLQKPLPLPRNNAVSSTLFGVARSNPDSNYEKCWYVCAGNESLLEVIRRWSFVVGRSSFVVGRWSLAEDRCCAVPGLGENPKETWRLVPSLPICACFAVKPPWPTTNDQRPTTVL